MNDSKTKRVYRMTRRAESAAQTERDIHTAANLLWREYPLHEITLESIAEQAGVSVRTVIRRFGTKEHLFEVCLKQASEDVQAARQEAQPGDIHGALELLLADYEKLGATLLNALAAESQLAQAQKTLQAHRRAHRQWCAHVFGPSLPTKEDATYKTSLSALQAATDLGTWKLLRKDLRHSRKDTLAIMLRSVEALSVAQAGRKKTRR